MARLPDFNELGRAAAPRPANGVASFRGATGLEDVPARIEQGIAGNLRTVARSMLEIKEHQDTLQAEDAFNKLRQAQIDLTYGQDGFANLKSGDAVNRPLAADYGSRLSAAAKQISDGLQNDYQKQLFAKRAQIAQVEMQGDIGRHVASQREPYAVDVLNGTVATESQMASRNPNTAPIAALRIDHAIDNYAAQFGKPKEWVDEKKALARSSMFSKIIEQSLDEDPASANQLFHAYADQLIPNDRVAVGHRVHTAILPAQAKSVADYVITNRDPKMLQTLSRTLDAGGEAALVRVSNDLNTERGAAPQKTRDTRAMLGEWVADAERVANTIRPNDPVFRDMVVQQVKNHVATIVAAQQGVQVQAQGTLLTMLNGGPDGKGPKPTTLDQLLAKPGAREAYAALDPGTALGIRGHIEQNANEAARGAPIRSDPKVVADVFRRIHLPDGDPQKITNREELAPLFAHGLNRADYDWAAGELEKAKTPEGNSFLKDKQEVRNAARTAFMQSNFGMYQMNGVAAEAAYRFNRDLDQRIDDYRKADKDPRVLFQPDSPDYVLKQERLQTFLPKGLGGLAGQEVASKYEVGKVYRFNQGNLKFKGGDPLQASSWEKVK